jgi:hypothetical protein
MKIYSGHGKVRVAPVTSSTDISAFLYNFNIDDDQPKPEHLRWLDEHIVPLLAGTGYYLWMRGSASRTGSDAYNMRLSQRRVEQIASYLRGKGVGDWQMQLEWVGESLSRSVKEEDEADRAVELRVQPVAPRSLDRDKPPPAPPAPPPVSDWFSIRLLGQIGAGKMVSMGKLATWIKRLKGKKAAVAVEGMFFEIRDKKNNLSGLYFYAGGGIGVGYYWLSATLVGPWNDFYTSKPIHVSQFAGFARFTTLGAYKWSKNILHLVGTPKGVDSVYMEISTGITAGAGGSSTLGDLLLIDVLPSNGSQP